MKKTFKLGIPIIFLLTMGVLSAQTPPHPNGDSNRCGSNTTLGGGLLILLTQV
ncbi:MAG: hypothetical protein K8S16_07325 [Bacteroidales bacterium]|nr:hypothetical protein [Bacteroidales bacterium]